MSNEVIEYLDSESEKLDKKSKTMTVVGVVIVIFLGLYLSWLHRAIKSEFLDPDKIAQTAVAYANNNIPLLIEGASNEVVNSAPQVAKDVSGKIKELFPSFRLMLQSEVEDSLALLPAIKKEISDGVGSYLKMHQDEIRQLYVAHKEVDFAEHAVDATIEDLFANSDLVEAKNLSVEYLDKIASQLEELEKKPFNQLSKSDKQKVILFVSVYNQFNKK